MASGRLVAAPEGRCRVITWKFRELGDPARVRLSGHPIYAILVQSVTQEK